MRPAMEHVNQQLLAEFDPMTDCAVVHRASRNALIRTQKERRDVELPAHSLGTFDPACEVLQSFRDLNQAMKRSLWAISKKCDFVSDTVRDVRDDFRKVDQSISERFKALVPEPPMTIMPVDPSVPIDTIMPVDPNPGAIE